MANPNFDFLIKMHGHIGFIHIPLFWQVFTKVTVSHASRLL